MFDVIDYQGGNLGSLQRCLTRMGFDYRSVGTGQELSGSNPVILPGVGNFGSVMRSLAESGLAAALQRELTDGRPYLGICVGLQVLFEKSEESPGVEGLGLVGGGIIRFRRGKVPHIGWNMIESCHDSDRSFHVYFVNSYYPEPLDSEICLYSSEYHGPFCAAIRQRNITAFQFHPEKSGADGEALIQEWAHAL